ncbi:sugar transferase [Vibrio nigripulchritudo]|uniref:sugar transferase n=1 Tax=Vibrio nigripulchritudo TaxID=28173 RepID=UPI001909704E|nr:sugar transferase [Vibrio nigripulchritudo]BCL69969.1 sugar transferase [Vibrio nigripulchritudo]BDU31318.1 sugar transferase [Vibrio nigripulchritudo]
MDIMTFSVSPTTALAKRVFDLGCAMVGIALTLPLFPIIALAIKLNSRGPVFYAQERVGRVTPEGSNVFNMIKFRTMYVDAEAKTGATWAQDNDPRITRVGLFLRKTRLDEIPQFWNVLKGDMSMIGPRPERPYFYNKLEPQIPFFSDRTYGVLPGITGLAQVNQGYDTCIEDVRSKVGYDHSYALALTSFLSWIQMDWEIIKKTVLVVLYARGR